MNDLHTQLPVELLQRIDAACDRFEEAWRSGSIPRIEDFLSLFKAEERPALLTALQCLQQELILSQTPVAEPAVLAATQIMESFDDTSDPKNSMHDDPPPSDQPQDRVTAQVSFRVIAGPHMGTGFTFEQHDTLFAGRLSKAQLRLEKDLHFSRHHFRLEVNPPTCFLMDLNSRNGTYVNDERIRERFLRDGDIVSGGRTQMLVTIFDPQDLIPDALDATLVRPRPDEPEITAPSPTPPTPSVPQQSPGSDNSPLSVVGYQLFEQLGTGDLGTVYRAQKLSNREQCALKILEPAAHTDEHAIQTFLREASVLNQLEHPHIIRLIEMGAAGRNLFFSTEYVQSISWSRLAARYTPEKRIRVACGLMNQILSALEYAHARSLVHRDVKPNNILITKKDDKLIAKLADFGLAKQYTTAGMSQVTRDGDVLGSLPFMSPDQFLNSREARPTCDLYSAGATLYWMLTGHEPIPLEGHPCKFLAILEAPPTPITDHNPAIPESLAAVVHRALEKTAEKRFASAAEMRHHLKSALK